MSLFNWDSTSVLPCAYTYPEYEVKNEKEVFHTFHPALDFAHVSSGSTPRRLLNCNKRYKTITEQNRVLNKRRLSLRRTESQFREFQFTVTCSQVYLTTTTEEL